MILIGGNPPSMDSLMPNFRKERGKAGYRRHVGQRRNLRVFVFGGILV